MGSAHSRPADDTPAKDAPAEHTAVAADDDTAPLGAHKIVVASKTCQRGV